MNAKERLVLCMIIMALCSIWSSCSNCARDARKCWDSGPIENLSHSGVFKGYAAVYTIDWLTNTSTRSDASYRVYERSNGDYIIDYDGKNCVLHEAYEPFGEGYFKLKWRIDYNHYIEDIPHSW